LISTQGHHLHTHNKYGHCTHVSFPTILYIFFNAIREAREFGPDGFVDIEEL